MKRLFHFLILSSMLSLLLSGCSAYNDDSNSFFPPGDTPNTPASISELVGIWNKACVPAEGVGFRKSTITVSSLNTLQIQELNFQNSATCEGQADMDIRSSFAFTVPSFTPTQVNSIDMTLQRVLAKINTANGVTLANTATLCGFTDWQVGMDKEISGRNCIVSLPSPGEPFYQIFQFSPTELFVGQIDIVRTGRTPETRPVALEPVPYMR